MTKANNESTSELRAIDPRQSPDRPWPTYDKGDVDIRPQDVAAAQQVLKSKRLFRYDDRPYESTETGSFEGQLASYFGVKHALACTSGTTAIALGLMSAGVGKGDEVIVPAFTFAATPSAVVLTGATPVVAEVDENLHLDPNDVRRKITSKTKAVIAVHMRGFGCDVIKIGDLASKFGLHLIEDAVPSMGVKIGDRYLGTFGTVGAFSTQSDKAINTGEGGFILTNEDSLYSRSIVLSGAYERRLHRHCSLPEVSLNDLDLPIFSFRMDEIRAAIGKTQLLSLPQRVRLQQENYREVEAAIAKCSTIAIRKPAYDEAFLGESFIFRIPRANPAQIVTIATSLRNRGIDARGFGEMSVPNVRAFWNWRFLFRGQTTQEAMSQLPTSARYISEAIDIPLSFSLRQPELNKLIDTLRQIAASI